MIRPLLLLALLALSLPLQAAFVTDRIEVPVHAEKFGQGAVLKTLLSGARVDVLMKDGKYTRIRTSEGISGWIESRYLSDEKPLGLEYLELRSQYKLLQDELVAAQQRLVEAEKAREAASQATGPEISAEELAELRKRANDTRWMKAEMNKARERAKKLAAELKALRAEAGKQSDSAQAAQEELERLRAQNQDLETRLAAALLVNEELSAAEMPVDETPVDEAVANETAGVAEETAAEDAMLQPANEPSPAPLQGAAWSLSPGWFFGSLAAAFILGAIGGVRWLDRRIRAKHGGFRIY